MAAKNKLIWTLGADFDYPLQVKPRFLSWEGAAGRSHNRTHAVALLAGRWTCRSGVARTAQGGAEHEGDDFALLGLGAQSTDPVAARRTGSPPRKSAIPRTLPRRPRNGSGSEISVAESAAEPAAMEPQEQAATELDEARRRGTGRFARRSRQTEREADRRCPRGECDRQSEARSLHPVPEGDDEPACRARPRIRTRLSRPSAKRRWRRWPFAGMRPGVSTKEDLIKAWGTPAEVRKLHGVVTYKYRPKDASRMTVTLTDGVVTTIVVQIDPPADPEECDQRRWESTKYRALKWPTRTGRSWAKRFPSAACCLAMRPDSEPTAVSQVILEALDAQPFLLGPRPNSNTDYAHCLADANAALELDPQSAAGPSHASARLSPGGRSDRGPASGGGGRGARARRGRMAPGPGESPGAIVRLRPGQATASRSARQQLVRSAGPGRGTSAAWATLWPCPRARVTPRRSKQHQEAIRLAKTLTNDPRARRRRKACELLDRCPCPRGLQHRLGLFSAQIRGGANRWLDGAATLADDLVQQGVLRPEVKLRVNEQALAALAGLSDPPDRLEVGERRDGAGQSAVRRKRPIRLGPARSNGSSGWRCAMRCRSSRRATTTTVRWTSASWRPSISSVPTRPAANCPITIFCSASSSIGSG